MKHRLSTISLSLLMLSTLFLPVATVQAAPEPVSELKQALEISPPVINLKGNPGETIKTQISIRDVADTPLVVKGQVNDFVANGEDGIPKILLEEGEESPYSMKSWFGPLMTVNLQPKKIDNLTITINIPKNAAPGGYYSTIRFTASTPGTDSGSSMVALSASLGALIFMRVNGNAKEELGIAEYGTYTTTGDPAWLFESAPVNFILRTQNKGTLHEQPFGRVKVKDMFGNDVGLVNINLDHKNVLPGSTRRFEAPLDKAVIGDRMLFGRYTADLEVTYGTSNKTITTSVAFWVIPWKLILIGLVVSIGGFFLLRFGLHRYNDYILSKSPRRRR